MAVLDTSFLIALEQRDANAISWLEEHRGEEHHIPDVVAVEYLTGHSSPEAALQAIDEAFILAFGTRSWIEAASAFRRSLRRKGVRFRVPDFWIGAWAMHLQTSVVTTNSAHFKALGVPVATWKD